MKTDHNCLSNSIEGTIEKNTVEKENWESGKKKPSSILFEKDSLFATLHLCGLLTSLGRAQKETGINQVNKS